MKAWLKKNGTSIAVIAIALVITVMYDTEHWLENLLRVIAWSIS